MANGNGKAHHDHDDGSALNRDGELQQDVLIQISDEQLRRDIARKRAQIKATSSERGKVSQKLGEQQKDLEKLLEEVDRRTEVEAEKKLAEREPAFA